MRISILEDSPHYNRFAGYCNVFLDGAFAARCVEADDVLGEVILRLPEELTTVRGVVRIEYYNQQQGDQVSYHNWYGNPERFQSHD